MNTHEGVTFFFPDWIKGPNRRNGKFPVQKIPLGRVFHIASKVGRGDNQIFLLGGFFLSGVGRLSSDFDHSNLLKLKTTFCKY